MNAKLLKSKFIFYKKRIIINKPKYSKLALIDNIINSNNNNKTKTVYFKQFLSTNTIDFKA